MQQLGLRWHMTIEILKAMGAGDDELSLTERTGNVGVYTVLGATLGDGITLAFYLSWHAILTCTITPDLVEAATSGYDWLMSTCTIFTQAWFVGAWLSFGYSHIS
jgi:hypothetical protein